MSSASRRSVKRTATLALVVASCCVVGCSKQVPSTANASVTASQPAAGSSGDSGKIAPYPTWAAAVAPAYTSHVLNAGGVGERLYQMDTKDDYDTVLAWYKARVKTDWPAPDPNAAPGHIDVTVNNVGITIDKNNYANGRPDQPNTMIALLKKD
jgi:hypothetical protein